jgi:hypothetical protein
MSEIRLYPGETIIYLPSENDMSVYETLVKQQAGALSGLIQSQPNADETKIRDAQQLLNDAVALALDALPKETKAEQSAEK